MHSGDWPPPIHSRVRNAAGDEFVVVALHEHETIGEFVVLKRAIPGGTQALPVTHSAWVRNAFEALGVARVA